MQENIDAGVDWSEASNVREMNRPAKREPKVDQAVTQILGKPVLVNDPRLIGVVVRWKKAHGSSPEVDKMDNMLKDIDFLVDLRRTFI